MQVMFFLQAAMRLLSPGTDPARADTPRPDGAYAAGEAAAAARTPLPDTLRYHRGWLAACPNGHVLTNDVFRSPARAGGERAHRAPDRSLLNRSLLNGLCPRA
jgi:hypothetical protein